VISLIDCHDSRLSDRLPHLSVTGLGSLQAAEMMLTNPYSRSAQGTTMIPLNEQLILLHFLLLLIAKGSLDRFWA
jgi:hypothetical protein